METATYDYRVCMCVRMCVSTPSVCIYCVCVYLLHLLKTLTNAPALIAPTQLLAASGRRDEALYQALGARLRTRRVRAVLCVGLVRTNSSWMIRSTCADIELKLAHAAQPGVCVCGDQTGELYYRNFAVATALHHTPPEIITDALVKRERWVLLKIPRCDIGERNHLEAPPGAVGARPRARRKP
jgi:hypothetical protein